MISIYAFNKIKYTLLFAFVIISFETVSGTTINGLAIIVEFKDYNFAHTDDEIKALINQPSGYTKWNNYGSINQYFSNQSNNNIGINAQVLRIFLNKPVNYYNSTSSFDGGQALVNDVVYEINVKFPLGFNNLSIHPNENKLWAFMIFKSGPTQSAVSYGIRDYLTIKNNNKILQIKSVALVSYGFNNPSISPMCHELGHHLFGWTDYYSTSNKGFTNLGHYCMMGSGGNITTPMPINPALRLTMGWISNVIDLPDNISKQYSVEANSSKQVYRYRNPKNSKEYYLINALIHKGYYSAIDNDGYYTDEGLAIWYVDEDGNKPLNAYPFIKLVQADGLDEMHDLKKTHQDWRGDNSDLFNNKFNNFKPEFFNKFYWKDGSIPKLNIVKISSISNNMTFEIQKNNSTHVVYNNSINNKNVFILPTSSPGLSILKLNEDFINNLQIKIMTLSGYIIKEINVPIFSNHNNCLLDHSEIESGLYILDLNYNNNKRIIIKAILIK